ncbi:g1815 [Coccomyxa elongata]
MPSYRIPNITVCTTKLNRMFYTFGSKHSSFLRQWFGLGTIGAGMLGMSVTFILMQEIWQAMTWLRQVVTDASPDPGLPTQAWSLGIVLPGLTVPWSHAMYLWIATAISLGVHEAGHALAAAAEGIGIQHMAVFVILLLPGAYVALDTDTLSVLSPLRTLRVVCAGVWHNAVLCCICWIVAVSLPWILLPGYSVGNGAVVRRLSEASPVAAHLSPGDIILSVNLCPVKGSRDWLTCLTSVPVLPSHAAQQRSAGSKSLVSAKDVVDQLARQEPYRGIGYCIPEEQQRGAPECSAGKEMDLCADNELCFVERAHSDQPRHLRGQEEQGQGSLMDRHEGAAGRLDAEHGGGSDGQHMSLADTAEKGVCLPARMAAAHRACVSTQGTPQEGSGCARNAACMVPVLLEGDQMFKVCYSSERSGSLAATGGSERNRGQRRERSGQISMTQADLMRQEAKCPETLIFVGSPGALLRALEVTNFSPKAGWISTGLPHTIEQMLAYLFNVSAALALINMAPVFYFDGQAALDALLGLQGGMAMPPQRIRGGRWKAVLHTWALRLGTAAFVAVLVLHALQLADYERSFRQSFAYVRRVINFALE